MVLLKKYWIYIVGIIFLLINAALYINKDFYLLNFAPLLLIVSYAIFFELDKLFLFVVFCTPISINLEEFTQGIGLFLPTEPILFALMCVFLFKQIYGSIDRDARVVNHPISIAIYFHFAWIFLTALTSELPLVSFKYMLSQLWFVIPCFFFGIIIFRTKPKLIKQMIWAYLLPLTVVLLITLVRHAAYGFGEEEGHWIMSPFFKDHTSYGAIIALFYPIVIFLLTDKNFDFVTRALLFVMAVIFTVALFYSYTRAAWVSVVAAFCVYLLFLFKIKFKYLMVIGLTGVIFIAVNWTELNYMLQKNDAEHTTENFSERIESMSNISSDASNLERLNRWNSAMVLFKERPIVGWGPGVYAMVYAPKQSSSDLTIISTNFGDGGNAHSEYLGPLAEQGVLGLVSMIWLLIAIFYTAAKLYIRLDDPALKRIVMMLMLSLVTYFTHGVLNNYLDTDKAAVPIWSFIAIIVCIDVYEKKILEKLG